MHYITVEQLLMDEGFLAWHLRTDEKEVDRWNRWIAASQENRLLAEEAVQWITTLTKLQDRGVNPDFLKEDKEAVLFKITTSIISPC